MMHTPQAVHTYKYRLSDGTGGTYRSDTAKTAEEAKAELIKRFGVKVAEVTKP